jgi:hypothetical protein
MVPDSIKQTFEAKHLLGIEAIVYYYTSFIIRPLIGWGTTNAVRNECHSASYKPSVIYVLFFLLYRINLIKAQKSKVIVHFNYFWNFRVFSG